MNLTSHQISAPKVIALDAPNAPWVLEIQKRLIDKGFEVHRWSSIKTSLAAAESKKPRLEHYKESEARYILVIDGYAPIDWQERCFGGGYKFTSITVDLVDSQENKTLLNINGSGYSEKCPPMSGTIFRDIAEAVAKAWQ